MKQVTTSVTFQMTETIGEYIELSRESTVHFGSWEMAKGDGTAKDQLTRANNLQDKALADQKAIRDQIMSGIGKYLSGGVGFDPAALSAMQSQFLNQNTANFNQAGQNVMASLRARGVAGGDTAAGGDFTRGLEALQGARASSQAQGILGTNIQNQQQALQNQFNAANVASGQTAQTGQNVGIFGNQANNALDQYIRAANTGFGNAFTTALGGTLGKGLGMIATGGIGGGIASQLPSGMAQTGIMSSIGGVGRG